MLRYLSIAALWLTALAFVGWCLYGAIRIPNAPILHCGPFYCGRDGRLHSQAEYETYRQWREALRYFLYPVFGLILSYHCGERRLVRIIGDGPDRL